MRNIIDFFLSSLGLILLSPVIIILIILIRTMLGSPVIFKQLRPGIHGKPFTFYKFRTMTNYIDKQDNLLPDCVRLTNFGNFLRKTSFDEIPSLWNVVKGDMSLVGPRPLLMEYLDLYSPEQARRHEVRPGVTGWAQVNGRNAISWEEKFKLDVWYIDNQSLLLDIKILCLTVWKVLKRKDINQSGQATMEKFDG